jgi:sugar O-acyltransferase (sialic acid O-acetyltransferase NeuD family)
MAPRPIRVRRRPREPLAILGAGGHAKQVIDAVECAGHHEILAVFDDDATRWGQALAGYRIVGGIEEFLADWRGRCAALVAIGDNGVRHKLSRRLVERDAHLASVIHPAAVVARDVGLGPGTALMALAVVNPGAVVGAGVIVNTSASVGHDCRVGDYAFIGPGARLAGAVRIGDLSFVGTGAAVVPKRTLGCHVKVGAGAVVIGDVPDEVTVVGVPARVVRSRRPGSGREAR